MTINVRDKNHHGSLVLQILSALRMNEILLMTGFSFVGMLFIPVESLSLEHLAFGAVSIIFYVMAVFFLNSYAGYEGDAQSERLRHVSQVPKNAYLLLTIISICIFSLFSNATSVQLVIVTTVSMLLWFAYYLKPIQLKSILFGGTLAHFLGGSLHFHMGYTAFEPASLESIQVSIYFSLILCTGHFNHEIMDVEDDMNSGQQTTTVRLGTGKALILRNISAFLTVIYTVLLLCLHIIDMPSVIVLLIASVAMLGLSIYFRKKTKLFQQSTRVVFLIAGLIILFKKVLEMELTW